jgi:hypothetical protein
VPALKRVKGKIKERMVPLAKVVSHQNVVFHADLSDHIQRRRKMREKLPLAYQYGDHFYLENGNHRVVAMLLKGRKKARHPIDGLMEAGPRPLRASTDSVLSQSAASSRPRAVQQGRRAAVHSPPIPIGNVASARVRPRA